MQIIQWFQEPYWTQNVILGSRSYVVTGQYNTRDLSWYLSLATSGGVSIVSNKRVTLNINLIDGVKSELAPEGIIIVVPMSDNIEVITRDNMGVDIQLIYVRNDEIL
jgi:hypothetical protein